MIFDTTSVFCDCTNDQRNVSSSQWKLGTYFFQIDSLVLLSVTLQVSPFKADSRNLNNKDYAFGNFWGSLYFFNFNISICSRTWYVSTYSEKAKSWAHFMKNEVRMSFLQMYTPYTYIVLWYLLVTKQWRNWESWKKSTTIL